jgi:hypothetical protein
MSRFVAKSDPILRSTPYVDPYSPVHRPTWIDFLFFLAGCGLSLVFARWSGYSASSTSSTPNWVTDELLPFLTDFLFLPTGALLFWPVFYLTQWLRGRTESLKSGEWLWGVAWLALLPWTAWIIWQRWGTATETFQPELFKRWVFLGYAVAVLALGSLAVLITLIGMLGRWRQPWTHSCGLVLLIWPAIWMACCLMWGIEIQ